jgi:hypothetical protein
VKERISSAHHYLVPKSAAYGRTTSTPANSLANAYTNWTGPVAMSSWTTHEKPVYTG